MAVYDRWHLSHPPKGAVPCKCSRGKTKLYPNPKTHEKGLRWQVRWDVIDEETGKRRQPKRNFAKKEGIDPEVCADAFDAKVTLDPDTDPAAGQQSFRVYAEDVIVNRAVDDNRRADLRRKFAKHVYPAIGDKALRVLAKRPSLIQALIASMERAGLAPSTIGGYIGDVSMVFNAALDDELITKNPCKAKSVDPPTLEQKELTPFTAEQVAAFREALPDRFAAMADCGTGLGMRQGEIFAFGPDDVEWLNKEPFVRIERQIKVVKGGLVFDLPKYRKTRTVDLSPDTQVALAEHMRAYPPVKVTLPWRTRDGEPVTKRLFFTDKQDRPLNRHRFNPDIWRPALIKAGIEPTRENMSHGLRHYFATLLLTQGESIKAVQLWLGHSSPSITLNTYLHFVPKESGSRMRRIIDEARQPAAEDTSSKRGHRRQ